MSDIYEYRRAPNKGPVWLALIGVILLLVAIVQFEVKELTWLVWGVAALVIPWMVLPRPPSGIRVDHEHLTLSAWREPRPIALDDIAHLKVDESGLDTQVRIAYRDGREEEIFAGDLPDIDTLIPVLATRGIPVREIS